MDLAQVKANLEFPTIGESVTLRIDGVNTTYNITEEFSSEQKDNIRGYIDYLYASDKAKDIFSQITEPIKIVSYTEGFYAQKIPDSVVLFDTNAFDGEKLGYISKTGEFVGYDVRLAFMHELIHAITGSSDNEGYRNFTSPEASLGPTQVDANIIFGELGHPEMASYDSIIQLERIENGTQFIKGKINGAANNSIDIGTFISTRTFERNKDKSFSAGMISTVNSKTLDNKPTNDLFIYKQAPEDQKVKSVQILAGAGNDYLYGSDGNDNLWGGEDNDYLNGGAGNDTLRGNEVSAGTGIDTAEFSDIFENYNIETDENNTSLTTITHEEISEDVEVDDGTDSLYDIEWGIFNGERQPLGNQAFASATAVGIAPRIIPLPLTDGVEATEFIGAIDTTPSPNPNDPPTPPNVTVSAPVAMLDGDVDYTLNISPYELDTEYNNVVYIIDTSSSIDSVELQTIKDAYTDLTNFYIDEGIAENINFGVVSFDSSGRFHTGSGGDRDLTADEALVALQNLTTDTGIGTRYFDGLNQADQFLLNSRYNPFTTTGIGYFFTDGQNSGDRLDMLLKARDVRELANVQAFGFDPTDAFPLMERDINWIDSNQGVIFDNIGNFSSELLKSGLANDVAEVNILLDGEVVDTITPDQLTDSPLGLTYEGSVEGLDVSIDAENIITAEVVFTPESNLATTNVDYTVTAGEGEAVDGDGNDIAQSGDGNQVPFEKTLDGSDSDDEITLGYADRGANGGAGGDKIIGNERDNILDGGAGNDTISAYGGDDTITTGAGTDKVNGGEGIDTVVYGDVAYGDGSNVFLRKAANTVSYNNTDTLTNIEFIQFSDVRVSAETLEITPVVEVAEISITEGNSGNTNVRVNLNLDTPAPVDITFDYNTEDLDAIAEQDYLAASGQVTIPAGETSGTINLEVIGDVDYEELEQFALNFSNLSGATFNNNRVDYSLPITIENDDILPLRVNAGKDDVYTDSLGKQWSANDGLSGGRNYANANEIAQTDDDSLYQSEYYGADFDYSQSVINGSYDVTLHFAEIYFNQAGRRVFDVSAEDQLILDNFDIYSEAGGKDIALEKTFTVPVSDGTLDLDFLAEVNNAKISAVEIKPAGTPIRINGGEENYTDSLGKEWLSNDGLSGGRNSSRNNEIAQTDNDPLYQTEYYGANFDYAQSVANGNYDVTLHFAETVFNDAGRRVFDVSAENQLILDNFDIYSEAGGKDIALEKTFTVGVNDGSIDLDFLAEVNNAKVSAVEIKPSLIIARVNAGEDNEDNIYTDSLGQEWSANMGLSGGRSSSRNNEIAQTDNDPLYQTEYYGADFDYSKDVANGNYNVTLHFAETVFNDAGRRVFDVSAEDQLILDNFDIISEAGGQNIAIERTFTVGVNDGTLDLDFVAEVNNAKVSAIEIRPSII